MHAITAEGYVRVAAKLVCVCVHGKEGRRNEVNAKWGQKEKSAESWRVAGRKGDRERERETHWEGEDVEKKMAAGRHFFC